MAVRATHPPRARAGGKQPAALCRGWQGTNYRGNPVSLVAGPAVTATALGVALVAKVAGLAPGFRAAPAVGLGAAALFAGRLDDVYGGPEIRGIQAHLAALSGGRVTTGTGKAALIGMAAVAASDGAAGRDRLVRAATVAGVANLVNLLDVAPGRALKASVLLGTVGALTGGGAACAGVALAAAMALPADLGERAMLGDAGANALGSVLGLGLATAARGRGQLSGVLALTLLAERVGLSALISRIPPLARLDGWGRRPARPLVG